MNGQNCRKYTFNFSVSSIYPEVKKADIKALLRGLREGLNV